MSHSPETLTLLNAQINAHFISQAT